MAALGRSAAPCTAQGPPHHGAKRGGQQCALLSVLAVPVKGKKGIAQEVSGDAQRRVGRLTWPIITCAPGPPGSSAPPLLSASPTLRDQAISAFWRAILGAGDSVFSVFFQYEAGGCVRVVRVVRFQDPQGCGSSKSPNRTISQFVDSFGFLRIVRVVRFFADLTALIVTSLSGVGITRFRAQMKASVHAVDLHPSLCNLDFIQSR